MDQSPIKTAQCCRISIAQFPRTASDQVEHRLRIAGHGRHHLQHVYGGGLMCNPFAVFAVARGQFGAALVELPSELRDRPLGIGQSGLDRCGHSLAPASSRTSSGKIMRGMVLLAQAGAMLEKLRTSINDDIPLAFNLLAVGRRTGGVAAPVE